MLKPKNSYQRAGLVIGLVALRWFFLPILRFRYFCDVFGREIPDYGICFYDTGHFGYLPHIGLFIIGAMLFVYDAARSN